jgi:hypothetical protein
VAELVSGEADRHEAAEVAAMMEDLRAPGDVFRLRLGGRGGHEQFGVRHGGIVQSYASMRLSTVLIAPTSTAAVAVSVPHSDRSVRCGSHPDRPRSRDDSGRR